MGLTPEQFWGKRDDIDTGFTLYEFDLFVQGHQKKIETDQELMAWGCANLMSMWAKKGTTVTPEKLLGRDKGVMDPRELQRHLDETAEARADKAGEVSLVDRLARETEYDPDADSERMDRWIERHLAAIEADSDAAPDAPEDAESRAHRVEVDRLLEETLAPLEELSADGTLPGEEA